MNVRSFLASALGGLALVSSSCRKGPSPEVAPPQPAAGVAAALPSADLGALPGAVYHSQAGSPIHWQAWTQATLKRAKDTHRLVFGVIAMPQYPDFQRALASLAGDPALVALINEQYVPVLIDGDAAREIGLLTADLCLETKRPLQLPMFLWLTHEGNPVAWIPVARTHAAGVVELFKQSHTMVSQMWLDSPAYVLKNSALDNANRRKRLAQRKTTQVMSEQPAVDVLHCIRQLASLYDPDSRRFDKIGGLFPAGALELLASAAIHPGLPADVRARALETTRNLMIDLLPSAMFDPLDGGVYSSRLGDSWCLPLFDRNCPAQARTAVALTQVYRATGDARALDKALGAIAFAEKSYATPDGLFALGLTTESPPEQWMWNREDLEKELTPADATWWAKATGMKGLGNIPDEIDPRRDFFRCNTLGLTQTVAEIATAQGQSLESFVPRFQAVQAKLLAVRHARLGEQPRDACAHAGATFRMVSAYAAAFGVTGEARFREQAVTLLERARQAFGVGPRLRLFASEAPESVGAGRAFHYALALQAAIDVAAITSADGWLFWSEDLATTAAELFTSNEFLKECPDDAKLIDLPVTDSVMLFDDSTAGLVSMAECRLTGLGRPMVTSFSELATPMPMDALDRPVLHTDVLLATLARHYRVTVVVGAEIATALQLATERLELRMISHRAATAADQVPAGALKVLLPEGDSRIVTTPEALQQAVLPSPEK